MKKNSIIAALMGFIYIPENYEDHGTFKIMPSFNAERDRDKPADWKTVFVEVKMEDQLSLEDLQAFKEKDENDKSRMVIVTGSLSGRSYTNEAGKKVYVQVLENASIKYKTDEKYGHNFTMETGDSVQLKKIEEFGAASVGAFLNLPLAGDTDGTIGYRVVTNREKNPIAAGKGYNLSGFFTGDFYNDDAKLQMRIMTAVATDAPEKEAKPAAEKPKKKAEAKQQTNEIPEIDIDDDEIPF